MATAISYVSESGDHYLSLNEHCFCVDMIVDIERNLHGEEFGCLYVLNIASNDVNKEDLEKRLTIAIEEKGGDNC